MITPANLDSAPAGVKRAMAELTARWPVGQRVRHDAGWTGRVTVDYPGNPHSLTGSADSHCLVNGAADSGCVCIKRDSDGMTAWYLPHALTHIGAKDATPAAAPKPAPKPRPAGERTRQRRRVS